VAGNNLLTLAAGVGKGNLCIAAVVPAALLNGNHRTPSAEPPAVAAAWILLAVVDVRLETVPQISLASSSYAGVRSRTQ